MNATASYFDFIDRVVQMRSNAGETVFTPFMGVGSEVWSAVTKGRRGIGVELKASYYRQAVRNLEAADVADTAAPDQIDFISDAA